MLRKRLLFLLTILGFLTSSLFAYSNDFTDSNLIQLDGSGSEDPDGDRLKYSWRQISGPKINLMNSQTASPSFYAEAAGEYQFELIVSDGKINSSPATVTVIVEEANEIPVAILPEKISIVLGDTAILDASNSLDADKDRLVYNFKQLSGPDVIINSTVAQDPKLPITPKVVGNYYFELIVNDGRADSQPVQCELEVIRPNSAPVARVQAPQKIIIKTQRNQTSQQQLQINKQLISQKVTIPRKKQTRIITDKEAIPPRITETRVKLVKSENLPDMVQEINALNTEQPLNIAPIASTSDNMTVTPGSKVVIKGFGVDPDGDSLQFIWNQVSGPMIPGSPIMRKNLAFIPRKEGVYVFELIVSDGDIKSEPAKCAVTVKNDQNTEIVKTLDNENINEDLNAISLAIPQEEEQHAHADQKQNEDTDISFRELFSID